MSRAMCPLAGWASRVNRVTDAGQRYGDAPRPGHEMPYAMNMRAAEAMVSSAPKAMKILPIKEVWSQVELSSPLAITGAAGTLAETIARVAAGGWLSCGAGLLSCRARSRSLS